MRALSKVETRTKLALLKAMQTERDIKEINETDLATITTKIYNLSYNQAVISSTITSILEDIIDLKNRVTNTENSISALSSSITQSISSINSRLTALENKE